jgi:hypothetical protein
MRQDRAIRPAYSICSPSTRSAVSWAEFGAGHAGGAGLVSARHSQTGRQDRGAVNAAPCCSQVTPSAEAARTWRSVWMSGLIRAVVRLLASWTTKKSELHGTISGLQARTWAIQHIRGRPSGPWVSSTPTHPGRSTAPAPRSAFGGGLGREPHPIDI